MNRRDLYLPIGGKDVAKRQDEGGESERFRSKIDHPAPLSFQVSYRFENASSVARTRATSRCGSVTARL